MPTIDNFPTVAQAAAKKARKEKVAAAKAAKEQAKALPPMPKDEPAEPKGLPSLEMKDEEPAPVNPPVQMKTLPVLSNNDEPMLPSMDDSILESELNDTINIAPPPNPMAAMMAEL